MYVRKTVPIMTVAALVVVVIAMTVWWNGGPSPTYGQESGPTPSATPVPSPETPLTSIEPGEPLNSSVAASWGTVSVENIRDPDRATRQSRSASGTSGAKGSDSSVQTPITADHIRRLSGHARVSWKPNDSTDATTTYRVERRLVESPQRNKWQLQVAAQSENEYHDFDVMPHAVYVYRVTPTTTTGELDPAYPRVYVRPRTYLQAHGDTDGVWVIIERNHNNSTPQYVTIKRFDHVERHESSGVTVLDKAHVPSRYEGYIDEGLEAGNIYYYTIELFYKADGSSTYRESGIVINPVAVMAGVIKPTKPNRPTVVTADDGSATISWDIKEDNRQALAYEVQRRQLKPMIRKGYKRMGTTLNKTMTVRGKAGYHYQYRVVPINMNYERSGRSYVTISPTLPAPGCEVAQTTRYDRISDLQVFPDVTGDPLTGTETPRTFDMLSQTLFGDVCLITNPDDYYFERAFYYKHIQDDEGCPTETSCTVLNVDAVGAQASPFADPDDDLTQNQPPVPDPDTGAYPEDAVGFDTNHRCIVSWYEDCTVTHMTVDLDVLDVEILYDHKPEQWGFERYRALSFSDPVLPPGRYGILYRVCSIGHNAAGMPSDRRGLYPCSHWLDTGLHYVGVESMYFIDPPIPDPDDRVLPKGVEVFDPPARPTREEE